MTKAYIAWALGSLGFYYAWFHRVLPSVMVDRLMADFAVSGAILGTLSALYFYAYAALQLPVGAMVDRWGPGVPYASALILAALGSALFATTKSIELAYLGRIVIGIGCAFGWVAALKIIALFFPPARFAMLSGAGMCIGLSGGFSGQMIAGTMVDAFGWRVTMWGMAASGTVLSLAVFTLVGRRGPTTGDSAPPPTIKEIFTSFGIALRQLQVWLVAGGGAIASSRRDSRRRSAKSALFLSTAAPRFRTMGKTSATTISVTTLRASSMNDTNNNGGGGGGGGGEEARKKKQNLHTG